VSRAYRVRVSESVERIVHVEDGVCATLELLTILPRERMGQLLSDELQRRGFVVQEDGTVQRQEDAGVVVEVVPSTGVVSVKVTRELEVKTTLTQEASIEEEWIAEGRAQMKEALRAKLELGVEQAKAKTQLEATAELEVRLRGLRGEMDQAVDRVTAAALKERAAQLGEIEEVTEDASGSLTIRVRV